MKILGNSIVRDRYDVVYVNLAVGQTAEPALANYLKGELGFDGAISVDHQTLRVENREAVFAGGDIVRGAGTVTQAVADGRRAAAAIHAQLTEVS
jgi:glutamate synthase (NADPH/NADH) small chain